MINTQYLHFISNGKQDTFIMLEKSYLSHGGFVCTEPMICLYCWQLTDKKYMHVNAYVLNIMHTFVK